MQRKENKRGLFSSIKTTKKPDEFYKQLVAIINNGQIKPGEKLPSERELASDLGISRQSIREAIYRAESIGLIEVRQGEGSFVVSSLRETLKSPMTVLLEEEAEKIFDFLEIRKLIEGWCAERAATMATAEDLEKLREILGRMEEVVPTDSKWEKVDTEFHLSIAAATKNVIAMHIMQALKDSFHSYFRLRRISTRDDRKGPLLNQHREIYEAISRKDPDLSKQKTFEHLGFIENLIIEDMGKASI
ncbi:MAG: FadR/GntR family transcriptional regulator [Pseudomonadota bacterium]